MNRAASGQIQFTNQHEPPTKRLETEENSS
jgi:hypothetical protein